MDNQVYSQIIGATKQYKAAKEAEVTRYMVQLAYAKGFRAGQESVKQQQEIKQQVKENVSQ